MKNQLQIIYDGECSKCNRFILFVKKYDKKKKISFIPKIYTTNDIQSIVFINKKQKKFLYSRAILEIIKYLKFWKILYVFILIPFPIRDMIYKYFAKRRKNSQQCKIK